MIISKEMNDAFENIRKQLYRIEKQIDKSEVAFNELPVKKAPKSNDKSIFHILTRAHNLRNIPLTNEETQEVLAFLLKGSDVQTLAEQLLVNPSTIKAWLNNENTPSGAGRLKLNYIRLVEGMI